jgi:hypothetical protein
MVVNAHFANERHDYGPTKRDAALRFFASHFALNISSLGESGGHIDETRNVIETKDTMKAFTLAHPRPAGALVDEASVLPVMRGLQPGWQPAPPATVGASTAGLVVATSCIAALLAITISRRKMLDA